MTRHARHALLLALLGGALLVTVARTCREPRAAEARFASAEELLLLANQEGLLCYDGSRAPQPWSGHFLSDRPRDPVELERLCKGCCGQLPEWEGVLCARDLCRAGGVLHVGPPEVGGNSHTLGRVLLAGDERLLRRLEAAYRRRADRPRGK